MLNKTPYVDDIPFDLGERQAQSAVYFAMGLFFSGTQPLQTVFTCMFFVMKYHVEKYNLIFVYNKQFDTKGILWKPTLRLMLIILYIFQMMQIGYFSLRDPLFFLGGMIYLLI